MTRQQKNIEYQEHAKHGAGYYAALNYEENRSSGSVALGPYKTYDAAERAVDVLAVLVAA